MESTDGLSLEKPRNQGDADFSASPSFDVDYDRSKNFQNRPSRRGDVAFIFTDVICEMTRDVSLFLPTP